MTDSTEICVVRHGETDWNAEGKLQGWLDVPLNERGRRQSREMAGAFRDADFSRIYTSPLVRSQENAQIIAAALGLPSPTCDDGLKERNFGLIQGIPKAELAEQNPLLCQQIVKRNPAAVFDQGESMDGFATRVLGAITRIAEQSPGERVLAVTHGWVMDVFTRHANRLPRKTVLHLKRKNGECLWLEATRHSIRPLRSHVG
ncbi:MAG: histidine phosphatase family protein [Betaproteobacteria bacterium]